MNDKTIVAKIRHVVMCGFSARKQSTELTSPRLPVFGARYQALKRRSPSVAICQQIIYLTSRHISAKRESITLLYNKKWTS